MEPSRNEKNIIIVDFDGTICEEIRVPDEVSLIGSPKDGVREALTKLKNLGYIIKIHSCRTATYWERDGNKENNREEHIQKIRKYMGRHNLPYDSIIVDENLDKPVAKFYIDNRSFRFEDNWPDIVNKIEELTEEKEDA